MMEFEKDMEKIIEKKRTIRKKARDWQNHHTLLCDHKTELWNKIRDELPESEIEAKKIMNNGLVEQ